MRTRYDQLAKAVLGRLFGLAGETQAQREIADEVQAADLWYQPASEREAVRARLGLIGRMAETPCLLEPFHATPTAGELLDCLSKQLKLRRALVREAARSRAAARPGGAARPHPPPAAPRLWILSAGRPERIIRGLGLTRMDGWPSGFWQAPALLRTHLVVLRDLPETRETLMLRLLGAGATFRRAVQELLRLPPDAWEAKLVVPHLLAFRVALSHNSEEDTMDYADELQAIYERWREQVWNQAREQGLEQGREQGREQGLEQGRLQTLRDDLVTVYQARFGALPPALADAIAGIDEADTLRQWMVPFATRTPDEIAAIARIS